MVFNCLPFPSHTKPNQTNKTEYEVSFLRLVDKITTGGYFEVHCSSFQSLHLSSVHLHIHTDLGDGNKCALQTGGIGWWKV